MPLQARHISAKRNGTLAMFLKEQGASLNRKCRSGRPANGTAICYNFNMAKQKKPVAQGTKVGGFVVGRAHFRKIGEVEGIELTKLMERRASEAGRKGLTAEEFRRTIVRSHRKG